MEERSPVSAEVPRALEYFGGGYNRAQSVPRVLQARYGVQDESLWRLVVGLGAGMGRGGFARGALTGGVLAIGMATGLQRGSAREEVRGLREESYSSVRQLSRHY